VVNEWYTSQIQWYSSGKRGGTSGRAEYTQREEINLSIVKVRTEFLMVEYSTNVLALSMNLCGRIQEIEITEGKGDYYFLTSVFKDAN
jgi:hypothetical protein